MESLGWVTPGAATEGVTPLFVFLKNLAIFFCSSLSLSLSLSLFIAFTRVSPHPGCHPTPFLPVRPRFSTILCKFAHKIFYPGVTPWMVSPGAVRSPPLVTPLTREDRGTFNESRSAKEAEPFPVAKIQRRHRPQLFSNRYWYTEMRRATW